MTDVQNGICASFPTEFCDPLPSLANTYILPHNRSVGDTAVYQCDIGSEFNEGGVFRSVTCLSNGEWTIIPEPCQSNSMKKECCVAVFLKRDTDPV